MEKTFPTLKAQDLHELCKLLAQVEEASKNMFRREGNMVAPDNDLRETLRELTEQALHFKTTLGANYEIEIATSW